MSRKVVYIDRAGGLVAPQSNGDTSLLMPAVIAALARFAAAGFELILLDDGAGSDAPRAEFWQALLASQGVTVSEWRTCTHATGSCDCRLPGLGLIRSDLAGNQLDRDRSVIVGTRSELDRVAADVGILAKRLDDTLNWSQVAALHLDQPRRATVVRKTRETDVHVEVDLDSSRDPDVSTGLGFFDHMLEQLGKHSGFALKVRCTGDLDVDEHHTVEDVALAIGDALKRALGDKRGVGRFAFLLPMDETSAQIALDLSGRPYFQFEGDFPRTSVGSLPTELVPHFFRSLSDALGATLHIRVQGENAHHMVESCFKGVARTLRDACRREGDAVPSTKGTL